MTALIQTLVPSWGQLAGLSAVIVVAAAFAFLGGLVAGRNRRTEADIVSGWAVTVAAFTLAGIAGVASFTIVAGILAAVAVLALLLCYRRDRYLGPAGGLRMLVLGLPLLLLVSGMIPTQWDELTQWLPNARYLLENDSFPRPGLPDSPSVFPAYPYGLPLVVFLASRLTGFMVENGGAIFNLLLLLCLGLLVARLIVATVKESGPIPPVVEQVHAGWGLCALAGLVVTAFNPTYVSRLVFSAYADAPTTITIGFAGAFTWMALNAIAEGDEGAARKQAWQAGLAVTAAIGLKQVNLVFLIALVLAALAVTLRDPAIRWRSLLKAAPYVLVLPLLVYLGWRFYVAANISGGEFSFRPLTEWHVALVPDILIRMASVASKKGGYFGIMTVAVIVALRAVRRPRTEFDRLAILAATLFVAYNAFLLLAYVAAFSEFDALRAASYWRYNTHLGGVCLVFAAVGAALLWRRYIKRRLPPIAAALAVALVVVMPVALAKKLRFDLHPRYGYAHATGREIARILSPDDRLLLVDSGDDGQYLVIMRYRLHGSAKLVGEINAWQRPTAALIRRRAAQTEATHLWTYSAQPEVTGALDVSLARGSSYLLRRTAHGWSVVRQWPHPGTSAGSRETGR